MNSVLDFAADDIAVHDLAPAKLARITFLFKFRNKLAISLAKFSNRKN